MTCEVCEREIGKAETYCQYAHVWLKVRDKGVREAQAPGRVLEERYVHAVCLHKPSNQNQLGLVA